MKKMTVRDFLDIVYDEQWVRLYIAGAESEPAMIDVWGADWIGGHGETLEKVSPYLGYEVEDMVVEEHDDPELEGEKAQMICVTAFPKA